MSCGGFFEGYALGNAQWGGIDGIVLFMMITLLWPWRGLLRDPELRRKARIFFELEDSDG